jgi:hypothetical protein
MHWMALQLLGLRARRSLAGPTDVWGPTHADRLTESAACGVRLSKSLQKPGAAISSSAAPT